MKIVFIVILFGFMTIPSCNLQAQNDFPVLEKNVNVRAKALIHKLSATKDTLLLESSKLMSAVYAVNKNYNREVDLEVKSTTIKIPLTNLSKGKHVFAVVQDAVRIVFVVKILWENSISSISDEELFVSKKE